MVVVVVCQQPASLVLDLLIHLLHKHRFQRVGLVRHKVIRVQQDTTQPSKHVQPQLNSQVPAVDNTQQQTWR